MGATSVTGVGLGSAEGMCRGTDRMSLGTTHLIGPHIVAAGTVTMAGSTYVVELPQATLASQVGDDQYTPSQYSTPGDDGLADLNGTVPAPGYGSYSFSVHLTASTSQAIYVTGQSTMLTSNTFTIAGGTSAVVVNWMIVKNGL